MLVVKVCYLNDCVDITHTLTSFSLLIARSAEETCNWQLTHEYNE